jgi:hypothetical protein
MVENCDLLSRYEVFFLWGVKAVTPGISVRTKSQNGEQLRVRRFRLDPEIGNIEAKTEDEVHTPSHEKNRKKPEYLSPTPKKSTQSWRRKTGLNSNQRKEKSRTDRCVRLRIFNSRKQN